MIISGPADRGKMNGVQEAESSNLSTQTQEIPGELNVPGIFVYLWNNENPRFRAIILSEKGAK